MTFRLVDCEIEPHRLSEELFASTTHSSRVGAVATFEGRVRDLNEGKAVTALGYEAYPELAVSEGEKVLEEAKEKFALLDAICVHRTGQLKLGEIAVAVVCLAPHREEAFAACRYIIDEIKMRVPIWKREVYLDGEVSWVNCISPHSDNEPTDHRMDRPLSEAAYYKRQSLVALIGTDGQKTLKEKKVLVIGAGGLGSPALLYLAGAGVGTIGICEFDNLEESNLHRQILYSASSLHKPKSEAAKERLAGLNPFIKINLHKEAFGQDNAPQIFEDYDLVIDATDSLENKLLVNAKAFELEKPLIQASVHQFEGSLSLFHRNPTSPKGHHIGQCTGCLWHDRLLSDQSFTCQQHGIIGATTGVFGSLLAAEAIKYLLSIDSPLCDHLLLFDLLSLETTLIERTVNPSCTVCGQAKAYVEDVEVGLTRSCDLKDFEVLPAHYSKLTNGFAFSPTKKYLLYCQSGHTSREKARELRRSGLENIFSLRGGLALNPKVVRFLKDEGDLVMIESSAGLHSDAVISGERND